MRASHILRLLPRVVTFTGVCEKPVEAFHIVFRLASVAPGAPGFFCVSKYVTHGVPAFSDRSAEQLSLGDLRH